MDIAKFLCRIIGIYLIVICLTMFVNMHQFIDAIIGLINNPSLMLITGYITLILGLVMVLNHNVWQKDWQVIITIIAWITLVKGIIILLLPSLITSLTLVVLENNSILYLAAIVDGLLGITLCNIGFDINKKFPRSD